MVIPTESSSLAASTGVVLVVHGGAGTIERSSMTPEQDAAYRAALAEALVAGYRVLSAGGPALDAVEAAICVLEDSPLFNAGRGAVFTSEGKNELDASIMDGATHNAGAVAAISGVRNPIKAARLVMERTSHVMMVGEGATRFARDQGLQFEDSSYFFTQKRWDELQRTQEEERKHEAEFGSLALPHMHLGTVGAVALDASGNLAAATSTGGLTNKRWGRVGDSPIIGAGTYADNATCAVSCTGRGEVFIQISAAHEVAALMRLKGLSVNEAARQVVHEELVKIGGADTGGLIALDHAGNFAMELNTPGMYRGYVRADGKPHVFIYNDE
ncbi:MAG TPA: isoaspartyl peptidase/L-asparaginase [Candidatus Krumholzibacteria bacterium]|nr:isoaspartyl peptidase/L-asparaginase [Candidatus Krumholzibacteria bacterium]